MKPEVVIGIDSSTSATKAIAWDRSGNLIAGASCPIRLFSPGLNYYEQDPEEWWQSLVISLKKLTRKISSDRISAIAIANQRETFTGLDNHGRPVRPAIIWLDERCKGHVDQFAGKVGEERIHKITGKPKDYAPVVYRLAWMKDAEPELFRKVSVFCDVHSFLVFKLSGNFKTSWASADPWGIFDLESKAWSGEILDHLGISLKQLPEAQSPGSILGYVGRSAAQATGLKEGTKIVAGGGDGQAAGLGVNALEPGRAYLNLGTAVVSGSYSKDLIISRNFRTMTSCSKQGYYCETSLRSGTFLTDWFLQQVLKVPPSRKKTVYRELEKEASLIEPGSEGVMVLPYWNAVMNPYWDTSARGCITGLASGHTRGHLYRAILEGIAMEQSMASEAVEKVTGNKIGEFALIGGGAKNELWRQIIADASGKTVLSMSADEASSLGAGISAAVAAGWFSSFEAAANNMVRVSSITVPVAGNAEKYHDIIGKYRTIYPAVKELTAGL